MQHFACFVIFLKVNEQSGWGTFTTEEFRNWKHAKVKLKAHVGGSHSSHNLAVKKGESLLWQEQHIDSTISKCSGSSLISI